MVRLLDAFKSSEEEESINKLTNLARKSCCCQLFPRSQYLPNGRIVLMSGGFYAPKNSSHRPQRKRQMYSTPQRLQLPHGDVYKLANLKLLSANGLERAVIKRGLGDFAL